MGRRSECSIYTVWRCVGRGSGGSSEPPGPVSVSPRCARRQPRPQTRQSRPRSPEGLPRPPWQRRRSPQLRTVARRGSAARDPWGAGGKPPEQRPMSAAAGERERARERARARKRRGTAALRLPASTRPHRPARLDDRATAVSQEAGRRRRREQIRALPLALAFALLTWGDNSVSSCRSYSRAEGPGTSAGAFSTARSLSGENSRGPRWCAKGSCGTPGTP